MGVLSHWRHLCTLLLLLLPAQTKQTAGCWRKIVALMIDDDDESDDDDEWTTGTVSYTHLTLPTIYSV